MLYFKIFSIAVSIQKVDGSSIKTFNIIIANFQILYKFGRDYLF